MVWFECTDCGESLKKPKVQNHTYNCSASAFNCIDCGRTFDRHSVKEHTTCVTEHDKYAKGATKPGGYAAGGFYGNGETAKAPDALAPAGLEFLTSRPPWKCNICNVSCTSQETLMGHASGAKHKRRAKAATKQAEGPSATAADTPATAAPATAPEPEGAQESDQHQHPASEAGNAGKPKQSKAEKALKKDKRKAEGASSGPEPEMDGAAATAGASGVMKKKLKLDGKQGSLANGHSAKLPQSVAPAEADKTRHHEDDHSEGYPLKLKKQKKHEQAAAADLLLADGTATTAESPGSKGPSWAKLAKGILADCEGHKMKLAKLQRKLLAAAGLPKQAVADHQEAIMQKISSKRKTFALAGGEVLLKAA